MASKRWSAEQRRLQGLLKAVRHEAGFTQVELSLRLGRTQSFVSKLEGGEKRLTFHDLDEICQVLGIDLAAFAARFRPPRKARKPGKRARVQRK